MDWPVLVFGRAALALLIERQAGYPRRLFAAVGHPVIWIGALVSRLDGALNRPGVSWKEGRLRGAIALLLLLAAASLPAALVASALAHVRLGWLIEAAIATSLIAQKSLREHVDDVFQALGRSLPEARQAVARIVGRDPSALDESGIAKAALESLAENTSDGVVAPALWYALLGLPGIAAYKAINTADSMIGHRSEKHLHFGWAAARLDDLVNLPASRLTGVLFAAAEFRRFGDIVKIMRRDAPGHGSPNAGWPEAAMAAALGLRFGGPRSYEGQTVELAFMGEGRGDMTRDDIRRGIGLFDRATWLLFAAMLAAAVIL
jgi:adenosylcobinamide-phosphate synthase